MGANQGNFVRIEDFEAAQRLLLAEVASLGERVHQSVIDQTELEGRLAVSLDRFEGLESERDDLKGELARQRLEQDSFRKAAQEALDRSQVDRIELARLRAEMSRKPVLSHSSGVKVLPMQSVVDQAAESPRSHIDQLAQHLVFDQLDRPANPPKPVKPADAPAASANGNTAAESSGPEEAVGTKLVENELQMLGGKFVSLLERGNFDEAMAVAMRLISFTRDRIGDETTEHALWVRNLGMILHKLGRRAEARKQIAQALEICGRSRESDPVPYAVCLIDLADLHLEEGDLARAKSFSQEALTLLHSSVGADHPLAKRAKVTLAQLGDVDPAVTSMRTVSISSS